VRERERARIREREESISRSHGRLARTDLCV
jgi:hypothetical protein